MADNPLSTLLNSIHEASKMPSVEVYIPDNNDPVAKLLEKQFQSKPVKIQRIEKTILALVTRDAIGKRPLSASSRLEAFELALKALENPTKANIRPILDILIAG